MISIIFFSISLIIGLAILKFVKAVIPLHAQLSIGVVLGTVLSLIGIFFISWVLKFNVSSTIFFELPALLISGAYLFKDYSKRAVIEDFKFKFDKVAFLAFAVIFVIITHLFIKSIYVEPTAIVAGNRLVWTDWPIHFAMIASFAQGGNIPPHNPQYAGQILTYPFFSDFLSAVLQSSGETLKNSLVIPGIVLTTTFVSILFYVGKLITHSRRTAIVGIIIGLFWGGIGFIYFLNDLLSSPNFTNTLLNPPHEYTFYQEMNLWFFSFLYSEVLPQRSFLLGLPLFFASLSFLIIALIKEEKKILVLSALILGIMPFFHMHAFLSLVLFNVVFIPLTLLTTIKYEGIKEARRQLKELAIYFILPSAVLAIPQLSIFYFLGLDQTISFHFGWMKGQENFFLFWFKNTGLFWPLLLFALFKSKLSHLQFNVAISAIFLFIITNIFSFAKWPYDNLKMMTFWYLICAFIVAKLLVSIYKIKIFGKVLAIVLLTSLVLSGTIEIFKVLNNQNQKIQMWSSQDIEISRSIINNTLPGETILAAAQHDHPASTLAGRPVIIGYPGNAWSWGLADWSQREADVHTLLKGDPYLAPALIDKYKVKYVIISQREKSFEPNLNENFFSEKGNLIATGESYKLYKLK
ncbi:hypothetical protein HY024_04955 [Candidatus Curtissbacteria bacterium]|nr:hypothetical protein [Candidatus Curtissbacteria bacterium]